VAERQSNIQRLRIAPETLDLQRAQLLKERAPSSALSVLMLLSLYAVILTFTAPLLHIAIWAAAAAAMIGATLLQPALYEKRGLTTGNARKYLFWHTATASATGLVWGAGAIWLTDTASDISIYSTGIMLLSLTLGGISPQSAYRRSYVGLASCALLPYAGFIFFSAEWPLNAVGVGALFAYAFFMSSSARVEIATRDALAVKQNQALMEELRKQRDALQKASEEKTRFLAATSHDLAQPLHAQGFFLAALREKTRDPQQLDLIAKIEASWRGLGNLLDGLLDVSRLDAGAIVADRRRTDIAALAARIADEFSAAAAEKKIALSVQADPAAAWTDPILLGRILRNLISNAIKFTSEGGHVSLSVLPAEDGFEIAVEDTGIGIPAAQQRAVFDEYVQLGNRERNREKGLGLGLSIVRRLAELLGIRLTLSSEPGKGTRFSLMVPGATAGGGTGDDAASTAEPHSKVSALCVLVIDDEDAIRSGMSTVLSSWGCEVLSAASGDDAIGLLDRMDLVPDVLIVDQRLGGDETGPDVVERLRDELNEDVRAIMMTGDISVETEREDGALRVLHKPVEPELLHRLLGEIAREKAEREPA
jgi:signal transduction histidine kinase/ActR/RegA family two-component response regulator